MTPLALQTVRRFAAACSQSSAACALLPLTQAHRLLSTVSGQWAQETWDRIKQYQERDASARLDSTDVSLGGVHASDSPGERLWTLCARTLKQGHRKQRSLFSRLLRYRTDLEPVQSMAEKVLAAKQQLAQDGLPVSRVRELERQLADHSSALAEAAQPVCVRWFEESISRGRMYDLLLLRKHLLRCIHHEANGGDAVAPSPPTRRKSEDSASVLAELQHLDGLLLGTLRRHVTKEYLALRELTWTNTSPNVFERIIASEKVHPFENGLDGLRIRVRDGWRSVLRSQTPTGATTPDCHQRHMFALFHPALVDEPLISVQVALSSGIESSVDRILRRPTPLDLANTTPPASPKLAARPPPKDTAIFYSINNTNDSLRGISLGSTLIKRVAAELMAHPGNFADPGSSRVPNISKFSTLSPVPGYTAWLKKEVQHVEDGKAHFIFGDGDTAKYFAALRAAFGGGETMADAHLAYVFLSLITDSEDMVTRQGPGREWFWNAELTSALQLPLLRSVAVYLGLQKTSRGFLLDPVAHFHVGNGAQMYRLNWLANCTSKGSCESGTVMVNYVYDLAKLGERAQAYATSRSVSLGDQVQKILLP